MENKVVIVTGASSGIGKALVIELMSKNAKVVMASRNKAVLDEIINKYNFKDTDILTVETDVSKEEDCKKLIDATINKFGSIDILINNAGISMRALFEDLNIDVIKKVMDVNFWGTVYCTKYALPYLLNSKGSVVGVSSIAGVKGLPCRTGYSASKFAIQGLLEVIRIENMKNNLHVLIAYPGFTASNIRNVALSKDGSVQGESPLDESKLMTSEEVAKRVIKAIIKRKRSLVMTSQGKMTVLLNKFFPKLVDKLVYNHMAKEPNSPLK